MNMCLQKVSTYVSLFPGWRLLGHLWRPSLIFDTKNASKVLQKWTQGCKSDPKRVPKLSKCVKDHLSFWAKGRHKITETMTCIMARRTARSALNICIYVQVYVYIYTYMQINMCIHIYVHIYIYLFR